MVVAVAAVPVGSGRGLEVLLKGALISQNGINNVRDTGGRFQDV